MMYIDRELLNPVIPGTIRFTSVLFDWLQEVSEREKMSFNQVVLQCCKNCMVEDRRDAEISPTEQTSDGNG